MFKTADLDGPGQSPKSLHQVGKLKELPASPGKRKRKRGRARRKR